MSINSILLCGLGPPEKCEVSKTLRVSIVKQDYLNKSPKFFLISAGTRPEKIRIQKWYTVYKDHITLADYEIHDGMGLELYYN